MQTNEIKKTKDINDVLLKLQKPMVIVLFAMMVLLIIYSFIFFTPFYRIYLLDGNLLTEDAAAYGFDVQAMYDSGNYAKEAFYIKESTNIITGEVTYKLLGINIKYFSSFTSSIQSFNHMIFTLGLVGLLVSLILFIYRTQRRKRFYVTNFVAGGIVVTTNIVISVLLLINLANWEGVVANQNYEILNAYQSNLKLITDHIEPFYSMDTFNWVFTLGKVISILIIVVSAATIALFVTKFIYQRKHKAIDISGVIINE